MKEVRRSERFQGKVFFPKHDDWWTGEEEIRRRVGARTCDPRPLQGNTSLETSNGGFFAKPPVLASCVVAKRKAGTCTATMTMISEWIKRPKNDQKINTSPIRKYVPEMTVFGRAANAHQWFLYFCSLQCMCSLHLPFTFFILL